jgi:hypothetical protein
MRLVTVDLAPAVDERLAGAFVAAAEAALASRGHGLPVVVHLTVHSGASERLAVRATITDGPRADTVPFVVGETPRELAFKLEQLLENLAAQR